MTTSILNDALLLKEEAPDKLQKYFNSIGLDIFDPIFYNSQNIQEAQQKILYILCAYSEDSPLIILRQDSKEEKEGICEYLGLPDFMRKPLMDLSEIEVKKAATQYLEQFAGQEFKTLMFLKIQLADMERDVTNREFTTLKEEGKQEDGTTILRPYYDIKEHGRAQQECRRLSTEIVKFEDSIKSKIKYLGVENMQDWIKKSAKMQNKKVIGTHSSSGLEHSELIK